MTKTMMFDVKGMTCDNCVHHVTDAIKAVPGVTSTKVDLATNSAEVAGDFDEMKIVAAVEEEGYEAAAKA